MKKLIYIISFLVVALFQAQSLTQSENYTYSRTYLEPVVTEQPNAAQVQSVQYFDGLGRAVQTTAIKASPSGKDITVPSVYNNLGQQTRSYLPLPADTQNGAFVQGITENTINSYYGIPNAYSEVAYEKSPLARPDKQAAPGADWQMSGSHTQKNEYSFNGMNEVKKFKATTGWNSSAQINDVSISPAPDDAYTAGGYYNANTLNKLVTKDEDNNETHSFVNSSGQSILIRSINKKDNGTTENLDTYYVYDEFGNLSFIIPPKAAVSALTPASLDKLCYQYKYDKYNRPAEEKLPGKGWEYRVYDKQGRMVLSQDANLRTAANNFGKRGWMFSKYDKLGRTVYTGFFANTAERAAMQTALNNMSANAGNNEKASTTPFTQNNISVYYTKEAFPTGSMTVLSVHYYDGYPAEAPQRPAAIQNQTTLGSAPTAITSNGRPSVRSIKTLPTASYTKNIENDSWSSAFIWYDTLGRVIGTYGKNHLGGFTSTESLLDFTGKTKEVYTSHSKNTSTAQVTVKDRFVYSPQSFLLKQYQQINANPEELLADYTYNDLGQVINKKVGNGLQSIDYTYNIRGWLTGINPNQMGSMGSKLFAYKLRYNTVEGAETPNNSYSTLKVKPKYNGSIVEADWKTAYAANEPAKRYGYVYDGVNRLRAGFFQMETNPYSKEYSEITDYDLNGNIAALTRTGGAVSTVAEVMDDLLYTYDGNRLTYLEETGKGNALSGYPLAKGKGQNIKYDGNGNMTDHLDKGFAGIAYNFLNLPSKINHTHKPGSISYTYSADGSKVQMVTASDITDYLGNFQYTTSNGTLVSSVLANEEGYYDFVNTRYVYQYKDHLGNVRLSYAKNSSGNALVLEENNYYPFGLKHAGYNTGDTTNNKFKYLYNGKELQSNGNLDYGWRQYMPDLGRWNGMDQLAESYHSASPYAYVMNNPINRFDPDGRRTENVNEAPMDFWGMPLPAQDMWNATSNGTNSYWFNSGSGFTSYAGGSRGGSGSLAYSSTVGYRGGFTMGDGTYALPPVIVNGQGNSRNWNIGSNYIPNIMAMSMGFNQSMAGINAAPYDPNSAVRADRGIMMIGGTGDPFGFFDIAGQVMSNWKPENRYAAMALGVLAIIATKGKATDDVLRTEGNLWKVGAYNEMKGLEVGLDAHHVGQSANMKRLVVGYEHKTAPTMLVPEVGHRFLGPNGIVSRSTKGFENARQVVARDIFELRRVYGEQGIPNSALQELIQLNKTKFPDAFTK